MYYYSKQLISILLLIISTIILSASSSLFLCTTSSSSSVIQLVSASSSSSSSSSLEKQRIELQRKAQELFANTNNLVAVDTTSTDSENTLPPTVAPPPLTPDEKRKANRERSIEVDQETWIWVPFVVLGVFLVFLLSSRKFDYLDGESLRIWLTHYVSLEALVDTLGGADEEMADEQRKIEFGHQFFEFVGVVVLIVNFFFGNGQNQPYIFMYLSLLQIVLLWIAMIADIVMVKLDYLRVVRSVNNKLRFAHCTYQALLFAVDELSSKDLSSLPIDVYFWAVSHYAFEAVGLFLEGLNMIGMSEFVIILLIVQKTMTAQNQTTGAVSAFGITSLMLSCASILFGMLYKVFTACRKGEDLFSPAPSEDARSVVSGGHHQQHHQAKSKSTLTATSSAMTFHQNNHTNNNNTSTPLRSPNAGPSSRVKFSPTATPSSKPSTAAKNDDKDEEDRDNDDDDDDGRELLLPPPAAIPLVASTTTKKRAMTVSETSSNTTTTNGKKPEAEAGPPSKEKNGHHQKEKEEVKECKKPDEDGDDEQIEK